MKSEYSEALAPVELVGESKTSAGRLLLIVCTLIYKNLLLRLTQCNVIFGLQKHMSLKIDLQDSLIFANLSLAVPTTGDVAKELFDEPRLVFA